ncbi:hypothetical protein D3C78_1048380 [compost metagenome]
MTIWVIERIPFDFRVITRMVNQDISPLFIQGKTVVPGAELAVFYAGAKHGLFELMPLGGIGDVAVDIGP